MRSLPLWLLMACAPDLEAFKIDINTDVDPPEFSWELADGSTGLSEIVVTRTSGIVQWDAYCAWGDPDEPNGNRCIEPPIAYGDASGLEENVIAVPLRTGEYAVIMTTYVAGDVSPYKRGTGSFSYVEPDE